jgi:hypothetical protein
MEDIGIQCDEVPPQVLSADIDAGKLAKYKQRLIEELGRRQYRRGGIANQFYAQVEIDGFPTRSWKPVMSFIDFVDTVARRHIEGGDGFTLLQFESTVRQELVQHFTYCDELQLPTMKPHSRTYSFKNGVFDNIHCRFICYNAPNFASIFPDSMCTVDSFSDHEFPTDGFDPATGDFAFVQ